MNAVETLEAAITKLEAVDYFAYSGWLCETQDGEAVPLSSDDNHVLLYSTIPAQLAILRDSYLIASNLPPSVAFPSTSTPDIRALALARAILGES